MKFDKVIAERKDKKVYRDGNNAVKVFDYDYSKVDVLSEALNQARIEETGLNIPKVKEVMTVDGKWAIVSEFIEGKTMAQLMEENPDKIDEYIARFVQIQILIQSKTCPKLNKLKDKMKRKISEAELIGEGARYELHTRLAGMPKHKKVCHGDFNPSNIIITPDHEAYILDWSHVTQGNASADAARTYLLFCIDGKKDIADKYLDLFCELAETPKQYVQKWLPIVAASQSVKGKPEEREFLMSWVDVVDYE